MVNGFLRIWLTLLPVSSGLICTAISTSTGPLQLHGLWSNLFTAWWVISVVGPYTSMLKQRIKPLLPSHLLLSSWPKQVSRPSPTLVWEEHIHGHGEQEAQLLWSCYYKDLHLPSKLVYYGLPVRYASNRIEVVEKNQSGREKQWAGIESPGPEAELYNTCFEYLSYLTSRSFILSSVKLPMPPSQGPYVIKM